LCLTKYQWLPLYPGNVKSLCLNKYHLAPTVCWYLCFKYHLAPALYWIGKGKIAIVLSEVPPGSHYMLVFVF